MKRMFVLFLSGVMLVSSTPMTTFAAAAEVSSAAVIQDAPAATGEVSIMPIKENKPSSSPTQSGLEEAIKKVKEKVTIPADYSVFEYNFNDANTYSGAGWTLTWSTKDGNRHIQVNCDADYHITSYNKYDYAKSEQEVSNYLKKELKSKADEFIAKTAPEAAGLIQYVDADYDGVYSGNYSYHYQRVYNGVPFSDNNVTVSVNSITGEVTSATINWLYDAIIPSAAAKLTKEEASKLIDKNMKMKLVYRNDYYGIYKSIAPAAGKKAYLVYEPSIPYISIDANTGKVYLTQSEWNSRGLNDTAFGSATKEAASTDLNGAQTSIELTQEEIAKVEELKDLITKEKAIELVTGNKSLYLDKNLIAYTATLNKQSNGANDTTYVWNISLNDPRKTDDKTASTSYRGYAYATVNAETGKLMSFYASMPGYYDEEKQVYTTVKIKYDKKQAQNILETFLKQQIADRFAKTILTEDAEDYIAYYNDGTPVYSGYRYQYNRVNEGIEYPYNNVYGSVDAVTGKIYSFGSTWDTSVTFESPKGAISADKALDAYLSKEGYGLKYEINQVNTYDADKLGTEYVDYSKLTDVKYEVRLVYRPDVTPSYISPFTGEQLNYDGSVYKKAVPYSYKDITDEKLYRNVLLLSDMNIGFEGESFQPEKAITVGELNNLLAKIGYGVYSDASDTADASLITREKIAATFINKLGLERLAKLTGIYKTGYNDEASISSEYLGAVAIAKGYGLLGGDASNNFNPKSNVSRLDTVNLLLNYIKIQREGIY